MQKGKYFKLKETITNGNYKDFIRDCLHKEIPLYAFTSQISDMFAYEPEVTIFTNSSNDFYSRDIGEIIDLWDHDYYEVMPSVLASIVHEDLEEIGVTSTEGDINDLVFYTTPHNFILKNSSTEDRCGGSPINQNTLNTGKPSPYKVEDIYINFDDISKIDLPGEDYPNPKTDKEVIPTPPKGTIESFKNTRSDEKLKLLYEAIIHQLIQDIETGNTSQYQATSSNKFQNKKLAEEIVDRSIFYFNSEPYQANTVADKISVIRKKIFPFKGE
ncbi:hypothetical protein ACRXCV_15670 [Halobacteriovorax sp. GFR7]|uniref:hypothetical protein n=1 Tax=unclassified Halobacteriovorax TaxID=2639665 RepID=UPI003D992984